MSDHKIEIVPVVLESHPNAEKLSVVKVFDNYQVCVRTEDWQDEYCKLGVYIPPDSVVPDIEYFKFLEGHLRIKAKKLRGVESYGLLLPFPIFLKMAAENGYHEDNEWSVGDDVADILGIRHYEPEMSPEIRAAMGTYTDPPTITGIVYDIEPWQKYSNEFVDGEEVVITEKIHGSNSRFTFQNDRMYCGSHYQWKKEGSDGPGGIKQNLYWKVLEYCPWVEAFCRLNPNVILYGEIFGSVQKGFNYGTTSEFPYKFRAFDVFANNQFLDYDSGLGGAKSQFLVPLLYRGPYSIEVMQKYVNGPSVIEGAKHIREGIVVKPVKERYSERMRDRLILKYVSIDYLSQEGKKKK
jgi:RNA ligase (TIGR02306 family)